MTNAEIIAEMKRWYEDEKSGGGFRARGPLAEELITHMEEWFGIQQGLTEAQAGQTKPIEEIREQLRNLNGPKPDQNSHNFNKTNEK